MADARLPEGQAVEDPVERLAILALLEAKPGTVLEVEELLASALALAQAETGTVRWYAFRLGRTRFGIFDTFADHRGREAHLSGEVARTLMARVDELLAQPPSIELSELLGVKTSRD
jgi:quinol monooxygenase YgiN